MKERHLAAPVKLWAMMCATAGVSLAENVLLTCILALPAFLCMALEKRWRTMSIFWWLLSGAGFASLPHSFPWLPTYGDLFRVLRPYVLQPYAGISDSVGSYCDSARTSFGSSVKRYVPLRLSSWACWWCSGSFLP